MPEPPRPSWGDESPLLPAVHLPRRRLSDGILMRLESYPVVLLHAPAGYGKTTLLAELQRQAPDGSLYLALNQSPLDVEHILAALIRLYQPIHPDIGDELNRIYADNQRFDLAYHRLRASAGRTEARRLIMLDDFPAENVPGMQAIEHMLTYPLPGWRFIISVRGQPALPLARWSASGHLTRLTERDLRLTPQEVSDLVSTTLGYELTTAEAEWIEADYEGWPLGVRLVTQSLRDILPSDISRALSALRSAQGPIPPVIDFLEYEIFGPNGLAETERFFLTHTAVLDKLEADVCNALLDVDNAGETLHRLHRRGCYVLSTSPAGDVYRYLPPFRAFLLHSLRLRHGTAGLRTQHRQAARVYEQRADWLHAVDHYLSAHAYDDATQIIEQYGPSMIEALRNPASLSGATVTSLPGVSQRILHWLDELPADRPQERPALADFRANLRPLLLSVGAGRPQTTRAEGSHLRLASSDNHEGGGVIQRLRQTLAQNSQDPTRRAELLLGLSRHLGVLAEHKAAVEAAHEGLAALPHVAERTSRLSLELGLVRHLAYLCRDLGELSKAEDHARRGLEITGREGIGDATAREQSLRAWMLVLIARGNFVEARHLDAEWQDVAHRLGVPGTALRAHTLLRARIAMVEHDYHSAEQWLAAVGDTDSDVIQLRLLQGRYDEALRYAHSQWIVQQANPARLGRMIAQTWVGVTEAHGGDSRVARRALDEAVDFFKAHDLQFWLAGAQLQHAWLERKNPAGARQDIQAALAFGEHSGTTNFSFWTPDVMAFACAEALRADPGRRYVRELMELRLKPASALPSVPSAPLTHRRPEPRVEDESRNGALPPHGARSSRLKATSATAPLPPGVDRLVQEGRFTQDCGVRLMTRYRLTPREIEVLALYLDPNVRGEQRRVNEAIAARLSLSEVTVRDYVSAVLKKLEMPGRDRLQLREWALKEGLIPPS